MTDPAVRQTERFFEAIARGEVPLEMIHPELQITNAEGFLISEDYHGRDGFERWLGDMVEALEDWGFTAERIVEVGPQVLLMRNRISGRARIADTDVDLRWWSACQFRDGLLARLIGANSRAEALAAAEQL